MIATAGSGRLHGYRLLRNGLIAVLAVALFGGAIAVEMGVVDPSGAPLMTSDVRVVPGGTQIPGARSTLTPTADGFDVEFTTSGLPVGHIVTLKALIFNQPSTCSHGAGGLRCGADDLGQPEVAGSVVYLKSIYYRQGAASATLEAHLVAHDRTHAVVGDGLANRTRADVHLVIVDRGPPIPNLFGEMLSTLGAGCRDALPGSGTPGPNLCVDIQVSAHEQR